MSDKKPQPEKTSKLNPYRQWLGIENVGEKPDYYQLLGIAYTETDAETIANVALEANAKVRKYEMGRNGEIAREVLSEIARAEQVLCDSIRREQYLIAIGRKKRSSAPKPTKDQTTPASVPNNSLNDSATPHQSSPHEEVSNPNLRANTRKPPQTATPPNAERFTEADTEPVEVTLPTLVGKNTKSRSLTPWIMMGVVAIAAGLGGWYVRGSGQRIAIDQQPLAENHSESEIAEEPSHSEQSPFPPSETEEPSIAANPTPELRSIDPLETNEEEEFRLDLPIDGGEIDDSYTFRLKDAPSGLDLNHQTGQIRWTPTEKQADSEIGFTNYEFTVELYRETPGSVSSEDDVKEDDGNGKSTGPDVSEELVNEQVVKIKVREVNRLPEVILKVPNKSIVPSSILEFDIRISDPDTKLDDLDVSLHSDSPGELTFNGKRWVYRWHIPLVQPAKEYTANIEVMDPKDNEQNLAIYHAKINVIPPIIRHQLLDLGEPVIATAFDPFDDRLFAFGNNNQLSMVTLPDDWHRFDGDSPHDREWDLSQIQVEGGVQEVVNESFRWMKNVMVQSNASQDLEDSSTALVICFVGKRGIGSSKKEAAFLRIYGRSEGKKVADSQLRIQVDPRPPRNLDIRDTEFPQLFNPYYVMLSRKDVGWINPMDQRLITAKNTRDFGFVRSADWNSDGPMTYGRSGITRRKGVNEVNSKVDNLELFRSQITRIERIIESDGNFAVIRSGRSNSKETLPPDLILLNDRGQAKFEIENDFTTATFVSGLLAVGNAKGHVSFYNPNQTNNDPLMVYPVSSNSITSLEGTQASGFLIAGDESGKVWGIDTRYLPFTSPFRRRLAMNIAERRNDFQLAYGDKSNESTSNSSQSNRGFGGNGFGSNRFRGNDQGGGTFGVPSSYKKKEEDRVYRSLLDRFAQTIGILDPTYGENAD